MGLSTDNPSAFINPKRERGPSLTFGERHPRLRFGLRCRRGTSRNRIQRVIRLRREELLVFAGEVLDMEVIYIARAQRIEMQLDAAPVFADFHCGDLLRAALLVGAAIG